MNHTFHIRLATVADAGIITDQRIAMLQEVGSLAKHVVTGQLWETTYQALSKLFETGEYIGWLAISDELTTANDDEAAVGGVGVRLLPSLPRPSVDGTQLFTSPTPHVINVYTTHSWRRRGVALALMQELLAWATTAKIDRMNLNASAAARSLYEQLGFQPTNGMRWTPK